MEKIIGLLNHQKTKQAENEVEIARLQMKYEKKLKSKQQKINELMTRISPLETKCQLLELELTEEREQHCQT